MAIWPTKIQSQLLAGPCHETLSGLQRACVDLLGWLQISTHSLVPAWRIPKNGFVRGSWLPMRRPQYSSQNLYLTNVTTGLKYILTWNTPNMSMMSTTKKNQPQNLATPSSNAAPTQHLHSCRFVQTNTGFRLPTQIHLVHHRCFHTLVTAVNNKEAERVTKPSSPNGFVNSASMHKFTLMEVRS